MKKGHWTEKAERYAHDDSASVSFTNIDGVPFTHKDALPSALRIGSDSMHFFQEPLQTFGRALIRRGCCKSADKKVNSSTGRV